MSIRMLHAVSISLVILSVACFTLYAQESYTIEKAMLTVYRDGVVHVNIKVSVDETEPFVILPLPSSHEGISEEKISNLLVLDENNSLLSYDLNESGITIYCLGATKVTLEYDTYSLTFMEFGLWTLNFTTPFELTVILPNNATIMSFNAIPSAIRSKGDIFELDLYPGDWEITYVIPIQWEPPPKPPITPSQPTVPIDHVIAAGVAIICAVALLLLYVRKKMKVKTLSDEETEVIRFIKERGGRVLEAELREKFPHIPRTSMWRLIRRLEKQGIVRVKKAGLQNIVELK
ncbi:MAG: hypothetical protein QXK89_00730 [Candidatus Bathyarchaeia archaeon]